MSISDRRCSRCESIALLLPFGEAEVYCRRCAAHLEAYEAAQPVRCMNEVFHGPRGPVATVHREAGWICIFCATWPVRTHEPREVRHTSFAPIARPMLVAAAVAEFDDGRRASFFYSTPRSDARARRRRE